MSSTRRFGGGVKDRPELKTATYRARVGYQGFFASSNADIAVTKTSEQEIEIGYAETLTHDAQAQTATITTNLNGGKQGDIHSTVQKPVTFSIKALWGRWFVGDIRSQHPAATVQAASCSSRNTTSPAYEGVAERVRSA